MKYLKTTFLKYTLMTKEQSKSLVAKLFPVYCVIFIIAVILASGYIIPAYKVFSAVLCLLCILLGIGAFVYTCKYVNKVVQL